jgi:hypothetical protein
MKVFLNSKNLAKIIMTIIDSKRGSEKALAQLFKIWNQDLLVNLFKGLLMNQKKLILKLVLTFLISKH